jgi:hypothetical protein
VKIMQAKTANLTEGLQLKYYRTKKKRIRVAVHGSSNGDMNSTVISNLEVFLTYLCLLIVGYVRVIK